MPAVYQSQPVTCIALSLLRHVASQDSAELAVSITTGWLYSSARSALAAAQCTHCIAGCRFIKHPISSSMLTRYRIWCAQRASSVFLSYTARCPTSISPAPQRAPTRSGMRPPLCCTAQLANPFSWTSHQYPASTHSRSSQMAGTLTLLRVPPISLVLPHTMSGGQE